MLKQHYITKGVKEAIWAQEDIAMLFDEGIAKLKIPEDSDIPTFKKRKLKHHDDTELAIIEQEDKVILMLPSEYSEFGEVISRYTSNQAVDDGILMKNPAMDVFPECLFITNNLFEYCKKRAFGENLMKNEFNIVNALMVTAKAIYDKSSFQGDNDKDFYVIKGNEIVKDVWFVRNEHDKLTAMLPSDY